VILLFLKKRDNLFIISFLLFIYFYFFREILRNSATRFIANASVGSNPQPGFIPFEKLHSDRNPTTRRLLL
jgi:hypothetical protein